MKKAKYFILTVILLNLISCKSYLQRSGIYEMGTSSNRIDISGSNSQKTLNNPTEIKKTSTINELLCVNKGVDITNDVDTIFAKNTKNRSLVLSQNNTKPIFLKKALPIIKTEITKTDPMNVSLLASYNMLMDLGLLIMLISSLYLGIIGLFTNEGKSGNEMLLVLIIWGFGFLGLGFVLWLIGLLHFKYTQKQKLKKKSVK
jgi:hypothetical protein